MEANQQPNNPQQYGNTMVKRNILAFYIAIIAISTFSFSNTHAQGLDFFDIIPAPSQSEANDNTEITNYPSIRLTHDKLETIELTREATSILIGNPDHLNIMLDTPKRLILVPKQIGATYFKVLDYNGDVIMERHAIIGAPKKNFVRIRKTCNAIGDAGGECEEFNTYYCPDMCHEVSLSSTKQKAGEVPTQMPAEPKE